MTLLADLGAAFIGGLLTPLGAVCVLPLYPTFLVYLSKQLSGDADRKIMAALGLIVSLGVVLFMLIFGLIFTTLFQVSLTKVINIVSPIAFAILLLISLLLIFNFDISRFIPKGHTPQTKNPLLNAFLFGFGFGAIVLPCNPLFIAALLARAALDSTGDIALNIARFVFFGLGIGAPLIVFSVVSATKSSAIINFFTNYRRQINLVVGLIMLFVSLYYIICVFSIFGTNPFFDAICKPISNTFTSLASLIPQP